MKLFIVAMLITLSSIGAAFGADFAKEVTQLDGKPFQKEDGKLPDGRPHMIDDHTTVGQICETVLLSSYQDEANLSGEEKVKRFKLASAIHGQGEYHLTDDEKALLKRLVAKSYNPLIVGQVWKNLDPDSVK